MKFIVDGNKSYIEYSSKDDYGTLEDQIKSTFGVEVAWNKQRRVDYGTWRVPVKSSL